MKLLHLDSSILGGGSVSRQLSADIVAKLKAVTPDLDVTYRDLAAEPVPHLSGSYLMATRSLEGDHEPALKADLAISAVVLDELLAADIIVIGVGFYNFTIPSQLKSWVDRVLIAGRTFRYGEDGLPIGLLTGKRVIAAIARGGYYGPESRFSGFEHGESYLRCVFAFVGIGSIEIVAAEGLSIGPEHRAASLAGAERQIAELAA